MTASLLRSGAAFAGLVLALSLARTRFHVVPTLGGDWHGVVGLPSPLAVAGLAAAAAVLLAGLHRARVASAPFVFLLVAAAPFVPALTGHLPLLLAPQGPLLALIAFALAVLAASRSPLLDRLARNPPESALVLFGLPLAFYLALASRLPGPAGPQGDEPHYLVMAMSLWEDGDLDLTDEFEKGEYSEFYAGELRAHASPQGPPGRIHSIHTAGLPLILAPAFALGGYRGAQTAMAILAAATALCVHRLARQLLATPGAAATAWAAAAFLPPLPFYAVALYPETPAALAGALFALVPHGGRGTRAAAVAAAAFLPWLHPKWVPLAAVGMALVWWRAAGRRERALALAVPLASLALLLVYFERTYGTATLGAAYGPGLGADLSLLALPRGLLALFTDRQFGLLLHAPFWALAVMGLGLLGRAQPSAAAVLALVAAAAVAPGAAFSMWWGGASPPTRFLVPAVPALALFAAMAAPARPRAAALLAGTSLGVVLLASAAPRALHNRPDGQSALLRLLAPALDLDQLLPSFVIREAPPPWLWLAAGAALLLLLRRRPRTAAAVLAAAALIVPLHRPLLRVDRAALQLLHAWDPGETWSPQGSDLPAGLHVPLALPESPWARPRGDARLLPRFDLPPGHYEVRVAGQPPGEPDPLRIEVRSDAVVLAAGTWAWPQESTSLDMLLPVGTRRLSVSLQGGPARIAAFSIHALAVLPRRARAALPWPRRPEPDTYRRGRGLVRATAIDPVEADGDAFRLDGERRFAVEAPCDSTVLVAASGPSGYGLPLGWGAEALRLPAGGITRAPAAAGHRLGTVCVVPVRTGPGTSRISFREPEEPPSSGRDSPRM